MVLNLKSVNFSKQNIFFLFVLFMRKTKENLTVIFVFTERYCVHNLRKIQNWENSWWYSIWVREHIKKWHF